MKTFTLVVHGENSIFVNFVIFHNSGSGIDCESNLWVLSSWIYHLAVKAPWLLLFLLKDVEVEQKRLPYNTKRTTPNWCKFPDVSSYPPLCIEVLCTWESTWVHSVSPSNKNTNVKNWHGGRPKNIKSLLPSLINIFLLVELSIIKLPWPFRWGFFSVYFLEFGRQGRTSMNTCTFSRTQYLNTWRWKTADIWKFELSWSGPLVAISIIWYLLVTTGEVKELLLLTL